MAYRSPEEIAITRDYLKSYKASGDPYFTSQPRQDTRLLNSSINVAILSTIAYGGYRILDKPLEMRHIQQIQKFNPGLANKMGDPAYLHRLLRETAPGIERVIDPSTAKITFKASAEAKEAWKGMLGVEEIGNTGRYGFKGKHYLYNAVRALEDKLYKFPRTFQASPLMSPWIFKEATYDITGKEAGKLAPYLKEWFPGAKDLSTDFIQQHGISYRQGALSVGDTSLGKARLVLYEAVQEGELEAGKYYRTQLGSALFETKGLAPVKGAKPMLALPVPAENWKNITKLISEGKFQEARSIAKTLSGVPQAEGMVKNAIDRYVGVVSNPAAIVKELGGPIHPGFEHFWKKYGIGKLLGTGVEHSRMSGMETLKRHLGHALPIGLAAYAAYKVADSILEKMPDFTLFGRGILPGFAQAGKRLDMKYSKLSQATGLTKYSEMAEEKLGEKLTLPKLAAFPAGFALTGAIGTRVIGKQLAKRGAGGGVPGLEAAEAWVMKDMVPEAAQRKGPIGKLAKMLGRRGIEATPGRFGAIVGAAVGLAAIVPLLPYAPSALASRERPDVLQKEYEGLRDSVVRRGRWWPFGKCLTKNTMIPDSYLTYKPAEEISIGDKVIARDGTLTSVKDIYIREHKGDVYSFVTRFNPLVPTVLTAEHVVPIIRRVDWNRGETKAQLENQRDKLIEEVRASDISVLDFVEIPVPQLETCVTEIDITQYLNENNFILDAEDPEHIYPCSRNWHHGKKQKNKGNKIKRYIPLDINTAKLFGLFLAEGSLAFKKNKKSGRREATSVETIHNNVTERDIANKIGEIFQELGGSYTTRVKTNVLGEAYSVRMFSSLLAKLFHKLFYNNGEACNKNIPEVFLKTSIEFKETLVEWFWLGDGHTQGNTKVLTAGTEERYPLIHNAQKILLSLGIAATLNDSTFKGHIKYMLRWDDNLERFGGEKQSFLWHEKRLFTQIKKIEVEEYDDLVYDFEVEDEEHLFQAGSFVVHNSPVSGTRGNITTPNWYQRIMTDSKEKQLYPEEYQHRPIKRFLKGLFDPYWKEKLHYYDRPYPVAQASGEISQLYQNTIGRIIKSPKYMHVDELSGTGSPGENQLVSPMARRDENVMPGAGAPQEIAEPQTGLKYQAHQFGERWLKTKPGLLTYGLSSIKKAITGSDSYFDEYSYLEGSERMTSPGRSYWDQEMGDISGSGEGLRRVLLSRKFDIEYRNPLRNAMPSFMPGPGDKARDFKHGDPYASVPHGESILPGAGFAARFPELEGVSAEEYPDIYKYKILAGVAPYSDQFKYYRDRVQMQRKTDSWNPYWEELYSQTKETLPERKERTEFLDVKDNLLSKYWLALKKTGRRLPSEHLIPISPIHKFGGPVDALSQYHENQLAPSFAPWDTPIESFVKPTLRMAADTALLGNYPVPDATQDQRAATEYFDKLKYMKMTSLANQARDIGSKDLASDFEEEAGLTAIGVNPYGEYGNIFRAVPQGEREFFTPFAQETDPKRREKILEASPGYVNRIYKAVWDRQDVTRAVQEGNGSIEQLRGKLAEGRKTEGFDPNLFQQAMYGSGGVGKGMRMKVLSNYFSEHNLPAPNHIAWHPAVDLEDIKLKTVESEGEDMHDYGLWETRQREMWRKPYLDSGQSDINWQDNNRNSLMVRQQVQSMLSSMGGSNISLNVESIPGLSGVNLDLDIFNNRDQEVARRLKQQGTIR